jgi:hypothetical protein
VSTPGEADLAPLIAFLRERRWGLEVTTYDQYGGKEMSVVLEPAPNQEQLRDLRTRFADAYDFTTVTATFD